MADFNISERDFTSEILKLSELCEKNGIIDSSLYQKYDVKRGLRDSNGKGVLTGLTKISDIRQNKIIDGKLVPCEGELYYRGININDIISGCETENRMGFEETIYLLLFGELPSLNRLCEFRDIMSQYRDLPVNFIRDVIMKAPSHDIMNTLARSVLTLYSYDDKANSLEIPNVLKQSLQLISRIPRIAVYAYHAYNHIAKNKSLYIHYPDPEKSLAENFLAMLRPNKKYSQLEAEVLDKVLILHAEHGGGNNSTFTTHVVTSSGTDTYSAVAAALCSLKGPKHGGASIKVSLMFNDIGKNVKDWNDDEEISAYLEKILDKKAFDKSGLIYGIGHAVYTISDPRAQILRNYVKRLAKEKECESEFELYNKIEKLAPQLVAKKKNMKKNVSANVDFYSGFAYRLLNIPIELYTPLFAIARVVGWSAHRIEEIINSGKIIRPAYMSVSDEQKYVNIKNR